MFIFLYKNIKLFGIIFLFIGIAAWVMELTGLVYICPYCRVERTVIAILGLVMFLKVWRQELILFSVNVMAFFGAVVAVNQNFISMSKISGGDFEVFFQPVYENPLMLSFAALVTILLQITVINFAFLDDRK